MNTQDHRKVVTLTFQSLPSQHAWKNYKRYVYETCMYPDVYMVSILEGKSGPWKRYFPPTKFKPGFLLNQPSFRGCLPPVRFYIDNIILNIRLDKIEEAARFAGVFSHHLADFAQPAHYYELDVASLFPPPQNMRNCNFHCMIEGIQSGIKRITYTPKLLGTSKDELQFYLEARLARLHKNTLASIGPMLRSIYRRKNNGAQKVFDNIMAETVKIFTDFCYTSHVIAKRSFSRREICRCRICDLREIEPYVYDVEYNFGHRPLVDVVTATNYGYAKPFRVWRRKGGRKVAEITRGICIVPHALPLKGTTPSATLEYRLPKRMFDRFKATVGLYADVEKQAKCTFEIIADGRSLYKSKQFAPKDVAQDVNIDISSCKSLKLIAGTDGSVDRLAYPIWGKPMLLRRT